MHELLHFCWFKKVQVETIYPVKRHPGFERSFKVRIAESGEEAITEDREIAEAADICLYVDGSGYKGKVGACAILIRGG
jgi:hypothetical protein